MAEADKPRVRVAAPSIRTGDSFQNLAARVGIGTDNMSSASTYGFNPVSRNRQVIEWLYGGSWLAQRAVDCIAEDMTRAGWEIKTTDSPDDVEQLGQAIDNLGIATKVNETVKWARLYGGAIAVMIIDGQNLATPLRAETVSKGQFKGLAVFDRWMITPSLQDLVTDAGPDLGEPQFYTVNVTGAAFEQGTKIHYSRCIRQDGVPQPFFRKQQENGWGLSIIEPLWDRLVAFDSTTQGAAQLVYKAHLRIIKIPRLREIVASNGPALAGLTAQIDMIRRFQSFEGLTLLDATDEFEAVSYTFSGLDAILDKFSEQLCGACETPKSRLFGEESKGLANNGEGSMRVYYDGILAKQESRLRRPVARLLEVMHWSVLGRGPADGFSFKFVPLYQLNDAEKADVVTKITTAVVGAMDAMIITKATALKELRQSSEITGVFTNITDDDIEEAENAPPMPGEIEIGPDGLPVPSAGPAAAPGGKEDNDLGIPDANGDQGKKPNPFKAAA